MKRTKLKDLLNENVLGILPSSKLMKMKWNPLKVEDYDGLAAEEEEESDQFSYAGEFGDDNRPPVEDEDKAEQETEMMAGHEDDDEDIDEARQMRSSIVKLLKQKGYGPIFQAIDQSKRQFKQMRYDKGEIEDTLFDMFGDTDPKIVKKIKESIVVNEKYDSHPFGKYINKRKIIDVKYEMGDWYLILDNGKFVKFRMGMTFPELGKAKDLEEAKKSKPVKEGKTPSLKSMLSEHILGELPSERLKKMRWNPVTQAEPIKERASLGGMSEIIVWDVVGDSFENLLDDINELARKTTDSKWAKDLDTIHSMLSKVEYKLNTYDKKNGVITLK